MHETPHIPQHEPKPKSKLQRLFVTVTILSLLLFIGVSTVGIVLAAYDKVTLGNSSLQSLARQVVLSLPFAPKTPAYVLQKTAQNMSNLKTARINASIALSSPSLVPVVGKTDLDMSIKGSFDKTDSSNIKSQMTVEASDMLSVDIKAGDKKLFIKANKFPTNILTSFIPVSPDVWTNVLSNWIVWDTTTLDSEARKLIEQNQTQAQANATTQLRNFFNNPTLISKFAMTEEVSDNQPVYKLHPTIDKEFIQMYVDQFGTKEDQDSFAKNTWSDSLKNLNIDIFVNKSNFYIEKISASFVDTSSTPLLLPVSTLIPNVESKEMQIATVVKFTNYNENVLYAEPQGATNFIDLFAEISRSLQSTESASLQN